MLTRVEHFFEIFSILVKVIDFSSFKLIKKYSEQHVNTQSAKKYPENEVVGVAKRQIIRTIW